jgi:hypothetical protein
MADILTFQHTEPKTESYSVDVTLLPDNLMFTVNGITRDSKALLKIADEMEQIARIIRTDVVTGVV